MTTVAEMAKYKAEADKLRDAAEKIEAPTSDAAHAKLNEALDNMNKRYCVVRIGGKTLVAWFSPERGREVIQYASFAAFKEYYTNQKVLATNDKGKLVPMPVAALWLAWPRRRTYDGVTFEPDAAEIVDDKLNLWRGFGVEPAPGDWSLLRKHILEVIAGGDEVFDAYVIGWMANMFQNPGLPGQVAVAIRSEIEGVGKGTLFNAIVRIFGQHGLQISSTHHLAGNFNRHLQDLCFLFADEALWPGDKAGEGTLARLITEPTLLIEPKRFDAYQVKNCIHLALASNQDWIVPVRVSGRRFAVNEASSRYVGDSAYFKALRDEMNNGGLAAMLYDLLRMDLSGFDVTAIPKTEALTQQKIQSLSPFDQWWVGLLEEGRLPGPGIKDYPNRAYTHDLLHHAKEKVNGLRYMSDVLLGRTLAKMGCHAWKIGGWQPRLGVPHPGRGASSLGEKGWELGLGHRWG